MLFRSKLQAEGQTNIPLWDKQPAYGRYPKSEVSDLEDWNTTPGPSCPAGNNHDIHHENDKSDNRNHSSETHRPRSRGIDNHRGHNPSDPSDSSSSDSQGLPWVYCGFGVFLNRSFYSPLLCDQNKPLVMSNGQVLTKLWSKEIQKKFLLNVAYNTHISPTNTVDTSTVPLRSGDQ